MNLMTVKETAERLNVSERTVYAAVDRRELRSYRFGGGRGTIRIPKEALDEYLERCEVPTTPLRYL